jgi:hypothetical protein
VDIDVALVEKVVIEARRGDTAAEATDAAPQDDDAAAAVARMSTEEPVGGGAHVERCVEAARELFRPRVATRWQAARARSMMAGWDARQ